MASVRRKRWRDSGGVGIPLRHGCFRHLPVGVSESRTRRAEQWATGVLKQAIGNAYDTQGSWHPYASPPKLSPEPQAGWPAPRKFFGFGAFGGGGDDCDSGMAGLV